MLTPFEVRRPEAEKLQAQRRNMANNPCVITPLNLGTTIKPVMISNQEICIYERKREKSMLRRRFYSQRIKMKPMNGF
jgi:hypothetical protein